MLTRLTTGEDTSGVLGLIYERRFTPSFGLEAIADLTFGNHERTALFAVVSTYRPIESLKLQFGPGFEIAREQGQETNGAHFILRTGLAWEFELSEFTLAPGFYLDFLGETERNLTIGLGIERSF